MVCPELPLGTSCFHDKKLRFASVDALHMDVEDIEESMTGITPGAILKSQVALLISSRLSWLLMDRSLFFPSLFFLF